MAPQQLEKFFFEGNAISLPQNFLSQKLNFLSKPFPAFLISTERFRSSNYFLSFSLSLSLSLSRCLTIFPSLYFIYLNLYDLLFSHSFFHNTINIHLLSFFLSVSLNLNLISFTLTPSLSFCKCSVYPLPFSTIPVFSLSRSIFRVLSFLRRLICDSETWPQLIFGLLEIFSHFRVSREFLW